MTGRFDDVSATPWRPPSRLSTADVEDWLTAARGRADSEVMLGALDQSDAGTAAVLQGAICALQREGHAVRFSAPEITFEEDRAERAFEAGAVRTVTENMLANSLIGLIMGQLCDPANEAAKRVDPAQRAALKAARNSYGSGHGRGMVVVNDLDRRAVLPPMQERMDLLEARMRSLLTVVSTADRERRGAAWIELLMPFVFEATENAFDHGRLDFDGRPIRSLRIVDVQRHNIDVWPSASPDDARSVYLANLRRRLENDGVETNKVVRLVEVTVADGGLGIAASMARSSTIHHEPLDEEWAQVSRALATWGTTKISSANGVGLGLPKMLDATSALDGFFEIRTGRLALTRTFLDTWGERMPPADDSEHGRLMDGQQRERPLIAGTSVSLLFPAR